MVGLEGFQEKTIQNILSSIEDSKEKPFDKVLFALGIRHVGATVARKLVQHFQNIDNLRHASVEEMTNVPEVGEQIAESVKAYFELGRWCPPTSTSGSSISSSCVARVELNMASNTADPTERTNL